MLVDALVERLEAKRLVAETDDDAVGFYRRCGFACEDAPSKFGGHATGAFVRFGL
jgi:hypothetical protein